MEHLKKTVAVALALLMLSVWAALFVTATDTNISDPTAVSGSSDPTDPTGGDVTDPTGGDVTDPTGGDVTDPTGGDVTDPTGGDVTDPTGGDVTDPTGNDVTDPTEPASQPTVSVTSGDVIVTVRKKLQLTAETKGFDGAPTLTWRSADESVAKVDQSGKVTGVNPGRAAITVTATFGDVCASDSMVLYVQRMRTPIKQLMKSYPILSYKYSFIDDYYYIQDADCWQKGFGFGKFYDLVAPYLLLEYDYVRVYFAYGDKDYMIQLWKGQYGLIFHGCEQGIYSKPHSDEPDGVFTFYKAMDQSEWPQMALTLYHDQKNNGNYVREFTRESDTHWWCSGFKFGHLTKEEPAKELRQEGTVTFKDPEMARLFAEGLVICGFGEAKDANSIGLDEFFHDGATVFFRWQNISRAETTMPIKIMGGAAAVAGGLALIVGVIIFLMMIFGMLGIFLLILL